MKFFKNIFLLIIIISFNIAMSNVITDISDGVDIIVKNIDPLTKHLGKNDCSQNWNCNTKLDCNSNFDCGGLMGKLCALRNNIQCSHTFIADLATSFPDRITKLISDVQNKLKDFANNELDNELQNFIQKIEAVGINIKAKEQISSIPQDINNLKTEIDNLIKEYIANLISKLQNYSTQVTNVNLEDLFDLTSASSQLETFTSGIQTDFQEQENKITDLFNNIKNTILSTLQTIEQKILATKELTQENKQKIESIFKQEVNNIPMLINNEINKLIKLFDLGFIKDIEDKFNEFVTDFNDIATEINTLLITSKKMLTGTNEALTGFLDIPLVTTILLPATLKTTITELNANIIPNIIEILDHLIKATIPDFNKLEDLIKNKIIEIFNGIIQYPEGAAKMGIIIAGAILSSNDNVNNLTNITNSFPLALKVLETSVNKVTVKDLNETEIILNVQNIVNNITALLSNVNDLTVRAFDVINSFENIHVTIFSKNIKASLDGLKKLLRSLESLTDMISEHVGDIATDSKIIIGAVVGGVYGLIVGLTYKLVNSIINEKQFKEALEKIGFTKDQIDKMEIPKTKEAYNKLLENYRKILDSEDASEAKVRIKDFNTYISDNLKIDKEAIDSVNLTIQQKSNKALAQEELNRIIQETSKNPEINLPESGKIPQSSAKIPTEPTQEPGQLTLESNPSDEPMSTESDEPILSEALP